MEAVEHIAVTHQARIVGDLLSLGRSFILYTTHPDLHDLDGSRFDSAASAEAAIRSRLDGTPASPDALPSE